MLGPPDRALIDTLVTHVRALAQPPVVLELQWELDEDEDERTSWLLELHVIVREAGPLHSELSSVRIHAFGAETLDARTEAHRIGGAVAREVGLALHAPPVTDHGGHGGSAFLRAQPAGAPAGYEVHWTATWWTSDGTKHEAAGVDHVDAESGDAACRALARRLERYPSEVLDIWATCEVSSCSGGHHAPYPPTLPSIDDVRAIAVGAACSAPAIARSLLAHAPAARPLELLVAFEQAFHYSLDTFVPLVAWRAGTLDDAALDAALTPKIEATRRRWDRTRVLRAIRASGGSIAAYLAEEWQHAGPIELIIALRDVFPMSLRDAKELVYEARDCRDPAALDRKLLTAG